MKPSPILSWGIVAGVAGLGLWAVVQTVAGYVERGADLRHARRHLAQTETTIARAPQIREELAALRGTAPEIVEWAGATPSQAALVFQSDTRAILTEAGLAVTQTSVLPYQDGALFLDLVATGNLEDTQLALYALEKHSPLIFVENLALRSDRNETLTLQLRLKSGFAAK